MAFPLAITGSRGSKITNTHRAVTGLIYWPVGGAARSLARFPVAGGGEFRRPLPSTWDAARIGLAGGRSPCSLHSMTRRTRPSAKPPKPTPPVAAEAAKAAKVSFERLRAQGYEEVKPPSDGSGFVLTGVGGLKQREKRR
jgi:hypothetical protein